jgi:predicted O-methyltransferase YrrM
MPMVGELLYPPDLCWPSTSDRDFRPSWSGASGYLCEEHRGIWQATKDIAGWQHPVDSEKLYELGYHCGAAILEIGTFAGRSALIELKGALRGHAEAGRPCPQFYGIDLDLAAVTRTYQTLQHADLADFSLVYHGSLAQFHRAVPITPTMVFVDGDHEYAGVHSDLKLLSTFLAPGTPVLCHDYASEPPCLGVHRAVAECLDAGLFDWMGLFGVSALLRATSRCQGKVRALDADTFRIARQARLFEHLGRLEKVLVELQQRADELPSLREENTMLRQRVEEYRASRWRRLGLRLGVVKRTSCERLLSLRP